MAFVQIPSGDFLMGTPDTTKAAAPIPAGFGPHEVTLSRVFFLAACEVTQAQYRRVMDDNPSWHAVGGGGRAELTVESTDDFPVENVSWHEAVQFCEQLGRLPDEQQARRRYRLPTEAEWEYACRETTSRAYAFNPSRDPVFGDNAGKKDHRNDKAILPITKVGSYRPSSIGLYDMRGNVWEWCADWFAPDYYEKSPRIDPQGPATGMLKIVRGSDWVFPGDECNYPRDPLEPWRRSQFVGFRVVCEVEGIGGGE